MEEAQTLDYILIFSQQSCYSSWHGCSFFPEDSLHLCSRDFLATGTLYYNPAPCYLTNFFFQINQINASVATVLKALGEAPYLKSLSGDVQEMQKDVARFGSRLKEMETQLTNVQSDFKSNLNTLQDNLKMTKSVSQAYFLHTLFVIPANSDGFKNLSFPKIYPSF